MGGLNPLGRAGHGEYRPGNLRLDRLGSQRGHYQAENRNQRRASQVPARQQAERNARRHRKRTQSLSTHADGARQYEDIPVSAQPVRRLIPETVPRGPLELGEARALSVEKYRVPHPVVGP